MASLCGALSLGSWSLEMLLGMRPSLETASIRVGVHPHLCLLQLLLGAGLLCRPGGGVVDLSDAMPSLRIYLPCFTSRQPSACGQSC